MLTWGQGVVLCLPSVVLLGTPPALTQGLLLGLAGAASEGSGEGLAGAASEGSVEGLAGAASGGVPGSLSPAAGTDGGADAGPYLHCKRGPQALRADTQAADEARGESSSPVRGSPAAIRADSGQGSSVGSVQSSEQGAGRVGSSRAPSEGGQTPASEAPAVASPPASAVSSGHWAASQHIRAGVQVRLQASTAVVAVHPFCISWAGCSLSIWQGCAPRGRQEQAGQWLALLQGSSLLCWQPKLSL